MPEWWTCTGNLGRLIMEITVNRTRSTLRRIASSPIVTRLAICANAVFLLPLSLTLLGMLLYPRTGLVGGDRSLWVVAIVGGLLGSINVMPSFLFRHSLPVRIFGIVVNTIAVVVGATLVLTYRSHASGESLMYVVSGVTCCVLSALRLLYTRRFADGMCTRCGYDLRGVGARCPECGTMRMA